MTSPLPPPPARRIERYTLKNTPISASAAPAFNRVAYAAAHVVADPLAATEATIDWDTTLKFRHYLWDLGFGVGYRGPLLEKLHGLRLIGVPHRARSAHPLLSYTAGQARNR